MAEDNVTVLDFATGTGTFLWMTYLVTLVELVNSKKRGLLDGKIQDHILKDFYGFEVMVTPYIIAHLKLTSVLREWRYKLKNGERIPVYLTNTLEPTNVSGLYYFLRDLAEESRIANVVKGPDKKIFVILGNPPYARISVNTGKWINKLLKNGYVSSNGKADYGYYKLDGKPLNERNSRWLQDDYVKFIRYAQWKIDKTGEGVIGIITNHSYLDNLTFRGMRQSLLNSFDRIYIINLHGHTRKEVIGLLGGDENVFDIMQGVAITIFIKNSDFKNKLVLYKDLYGSRASKFEWLDSKKSVLNVDWEILEPTSPNYYLIPVDKNLKEKYDDFWKITDIFPEHNVGIATTRDDFVLSFKRNDLEERMNDFKSDKHDIDYWREKYHLKNKINWNLIEVKEEVSKYDNTCDYIKKILYRPFDLRWIFYDKKLVERPRIEIMKNMISPKTSELNVFGKQGRNIGLIISRSSAKSSFSNVIRSYAVKVSVRMGLIR